MDLRRHRSFDSFRDEISGRLVLLTTHAPTAHIDFLFRRDDVLLLGRESEGAPEHVHAAAAARVAVPLAPGMRSLNVAVAAAMVAGEALRQTAAYPGRPAVGASAPQEDS
jgi:tRNA (cytidine/uridine-2'-O-)-methyltransferase